MPAVAVCGRFDNAPVHLIILSPRFATRDLKPEYESNRTSHKIKPVAYTVKKENKAALKKERDAAERLQKMAIMRGKEAKAKRAKMKDVRPEESRDERRNRLTREATQSRHAAMVAKLPTGYEPLRGIKLGVKFDYARRALSKGPVHGVKIGKEWYTSAPVIKAYFAQKKARNIEALRKSRKGRRNEQKSR